VRGCPSIFPTDHLQLGRGTLILFVLKGPSADFILGRIWEAVIDEVTKDILNTDDKALQKAVARRKFSQMNCSLM
jgi:hypothetical protein